MFSTNFIIAILLFTISTSFTPGPNNFLLISSGMKFGLRRTLGHIFGIAVGFPIMLFIVGLVFSSIATLSTKIFNILSIIGMLYLTYLAYKIIFSDLLYKENAKSKPLTFLQAVLFQWVNPKAWVVAFSIASSYIVLEYNFLTQLVFISIVYFIVAAVSSLTWAFFGSFINKNIEKKLYLKTINIFLGLLLIISIIQMLPQKF